MYTRTLCQIQILSLTHPIVENSSQIIQSQDIALCQFWKLVRVVKVTGHLSTVVNKPVLSDSWSNLPIAGILAIATILYFDMENFTVNIACWQGHCTIEQSPPPLGPRTVQYSILMLGLSSHRPLPVFSNIRLSSVFFNKVSLSTVICSRYLQKRSYYLILEPQSL